MAAMRKKERNGPGMVTSSEEEEAEAPGPEDCVPLDCSEEAAGPAVQPLRGA